MHQSSPFCQVTPSDTLPPKLIFHVSFQVYLYIYIYIYIIFILCTLIFSPGESEKPCVVTLVDDSIHEEDEEFRLVLGTPKSKSPYGASIGEQKEALVTITDEKDSTCFLELNILQIIKQHLHKWEKMYQISWLRKKKIPLAQAKECVFVLS